MCLPSSTTSPVSKKPSSQQELSTAHSSSNNLASDPRTVIHAVNPEFASIASTTDLVNDFIVSNHEQNAFYAGGGSAWNSKWSAPSGCTNGFQEIPNDELKSFGAGEKT
ncbi:hypothetical protein AC579_2307 [Pseudocercospora musae]|uniref:Uncharacterized protein n=1 Tax=Pseudocercospora musae TaxID=113226 RepID=A0A139IUS7_9PEZI|nr:hypothetical protein AC579_2307 [Pseudocercospora musae]